MIKRFFHIHRSSHKGGRRTRGSLRYRRFTYRFMPVAERIRLVVGLLSVIAAGSIRRAYAVLTLALVCFAVYSFALLIIEPDLSTKDILFEVNSAMFTVGSSLGVTDKLSNLSLIILSTAMFIGRVGILSMLAGFAAGSFDRSRYYPTDSLIIS